MKLERKKEKILYIWPAQLQVSQNPNPENKHEVIYFSV